MFETLSNLKLRLGFWLLLAIGLIIGLALLSPAQLPVVLYKGALVTLGGVIGYWLDRHLFPYARPHLLFEQAKQYADAGDDVGVYVMVSAWLGTVRRAVVVLACILGLTLGL
ncbi:putative holin [Neptuniibacter sp.]|uniref:putative holin n=1 Tax=Neptuniibacter sp. TaxID=1962643 RepID=UPI003B5BE3AB